MRNRGLLWVLLAVILLGSAVPVFAVDPVIQRGIDTFTTTANGRTYHDFAKNPIPAGFFCAGSAPFKERVVLRGLPLATDGKGNLHGADTVFERLDDAAFDARHNAVTRLQVRALSLVSVTPIHTSCGAFHVYVTLADKQPVTTMSISRTQAAGGTFVAPLAINARLTFVPVKAEKKPRKLELTAAINFPAVPISWSMTAGAATKHVGAVVVDTNGDLTPDTRFAGSSNFFPGWSPDGVVPKVTGCSLCEPGVEPCHTSDTAQHCTGAVWACNPYQCP